jgi:uncharacterized membrane protein YfcA
MSRARPVELALSAWFADIRPEADFPVFRGVKRKRLLRIGGAQQPLRFEGSSRSLSFRGAEKIGGWKPLRTHEVRGPKWFRIICEWPDTLERVVGGTASILVPGVLFLATLVRSSLGFGEALVAVPLLALLLPVEVAAPVAVMVSVTVALIVVLQDWRKVHARSAVRLALPTMLGIPLGLALLKLVAEPVVKGALAALIIAFSSYSLLGNKRRELRDDKFAWLFGFSAGVLGGAYGMNGPPLAIYGSLRGWSPQHFRATLQGYFLPASVAGLWGYWLAGMWTPAVNRFYLLSLPLVIVATFTGRAINRRLGADRFVLYLHCGLIAIGVILLSQATAG